MKSAATNDFKCPQPSGESVAARDKPDRRRGGIPQEGQTDALPAGVQAGPTPSHSTGVGHQSSAAQSQDVRDWWMLDEQAQEDNLMRHSFSGDPWGLCSRCQHPAFHEIHQETT